MYAFWYSKESKPENRDLSFLIKQRIQTGKYSPVKTTHPKDHKQTIQNNQLQKPQNQIFARNTIIPYTYKIIFETNILIYFLCNSLVHNHSLKIVM